VAIPVGDERAVHVILTNEGRKLARKVTTQIIERLTALAASLSDTSRTRLSKALTQLVF
jgi:DNA-binding MarR family transcriptional regulator